MNIAAAMPGTGRLAGKTALVTGGSKGELLRAIASPVTFAILIAAQELAKLPF